MPARAERRQPRQDLGRTAPAAGREREAEAEARATHQSSDPNDQTENGREREYVLFLLVLVTRRKGAAAAAGVGLEAAGLPESNGFRTRPVVGGPAAGEVVEAPAPRERNRSARPGKIGADIF